MTTENHTKSTEILGKLLGREEIAQAQNKTYKEALDHVFNIIDKLPPEQKGAKTLHGNCQQRCSSLRKLLQQRCSLGSILKISSSQPCRELSPQPYLPLDKEFVISQNPKFIFLGGSIWRNKSEGRPNAYGIYRSRRASSRKT